MKWRVGRNGKTNSMMNNTLMVHGLVGDEINQVKQLSFKPTNIVDNTDYFNKIDMDDERQNALRSEDKLKKEALPVQWTTSCWKTENFEHGFWTVSMRGV